ncbi:recombinase family protein [Shinella sumterensis]|uniref:recombinase family protein n=1 Tax=Shinella sumterensis TaxID=1967501 RepID=UPI003F8709F6
MKQYVVYTRVSTEDQGRSGLGLEAQKRDIEIFLEKFSAVPYEVIAEFQDVLSGATDERPELQKALRKVRETGAELLIAKLDRLSRKVAFIAALMDDPKVRLRVAQMPNADKFQLHIYAALAEQERDFISARTKAALKVAKQRHAMRRLEDPSYSKQIGGLRDKTMKRNAAVQAKAAEDARRAMKVIGPLRDAGKNLSEIAAVLNDMVMPTARGGQWTAKQVSRILDRVSATEAGEA